jgi:hypothetical protein
MEETADMQGQVKGYYQSIQVLQEAEESMEIERVVAEQ